ncbi:MAG: LamG-like jellyroll fold domain-containing protein, partial [Planctomycetota bacterium]
MVRAALALLLTCSALTAEEPNVTSLADTVRWAPHSKTADIALRRLGDRGPAGWKTLRALIVEFSRTDERIALKAVAELVGGAEPERIDAIYESYARVKDMKEVRAALALGLAEGYPRHAEVLHRRLRANEEGARELLLLLAERELPDSELLACLPLDPIGLAAYAVLRERKRTPALESLAPLARKVAQRGLAPASCRAFVEEFAASPDFLVLQALAGVLDEPDESTRIGAHSLLLTVSGRKLPAKSLDWRSWIEAHAGRYTPPGPASPGGVAAAVARAARYLRADLLDDGRCLWMKDRHGEQAVGSTSMVVLALRAAGYPARDEAIEKAIRETLLIHGTDGTTGLPKTKNPTYCYSLLAMALQAVNANRFREPLQGISYRLSGGQLESGMWTYDLRSRTEPGRGKFGDNSNTQYAILGLRACRVAGVEVLRSTWERSERFFRGTINPAGGWGYRATGRDSLIRQVSMTSAGLGSLAICVEALHPDDAAERLKTDKVARSALAYLGVRLYTETYDKQELYAWFGVERACVLTGTKLFRDGKREFDWYAEGARRLVEWQSPQGYWGRPDAKNDVRGSGYGTVIDTCYGILFLTKATATIGRGAGTGVVPVAFPPEPKEKTPEPVPMRKPAPAAPPLLIVEREKVSTSTGEAVIRGRLSDPGARLTVDDKAVEVAGNGIFAASVTVEQSRLVKVEATGRDGKAQRVVVSVTIDVTAPTLRLVGATIRRVGKQFIEFEADEPLSDVRVAGRIFPVEGRRAQAIVDLREGKRSLTVSATDLAGNEGRATFALEAANKVLVLDGKSVVRVDLAERPDHFTVECWVRGPKPAGTATLMGDAEGAGWDIVWCYRKIPFPSGWAYIDGRWHTIPAKRAWKWSAWTHLALCYDGRWLRYFVNGRLQGTSEGFRFHKSRRPFYIGAEPDH